MEHSKQLVGYITVDARENSFRGAALVTDYRGIPTDFRYTEPVRPTKLERILYGSALDIYLKEDIILDNLISAIETRPALWLVGDEDLLSPVQKVSKLPAVAARSTSRPPMEQSGQCEPTAEEGVFLLQADNISAPLMLTVTPDNAPRISQIAAILTDAASGMELLEPFTRIEKALASVTESESR
jgi:hypothetical protein